MDKAKYIVKYLILLVTQPEETWLHLCKEDVQEAKPQYMMTNYYWPLLGFMALFIFLASGYSREGGFNLQHGMTTMVPSLVGFFIGPYLAMFLLKELLPTRFFELKNPDQDRLHLFVFYCTSYLVLVEMACSLIPSIAFVHLADYYLVYIIWTAMTTIVRIPANHSWLFCFVAFLVIYFSPSLTIKLLQFMQH